MLGLLAELLSNDENRFVRACAAEAVGCAARRAAALISKGELPPTAGGVVSALLPGLALGGEEAGKEGGAGDAAGVFADSGSTYKFSNRNMVRENASVSALSICSNAGALASAVPEADWLALIEVLKARTSAKSQQRDDDRYAYGFELQALHALAATAPGRLAPSVTAAAAEAAAEPMLWVPPALELQEPRLVQPHFDTERYLWVPEPTAVSK